MISTEFFSIIHIIVLIIAMIYRLLGGAIKIERLTCRHESSASKAKSGSVKLQLSEGYKAMKMDALTRLKYDKNGIEQKKTFTLDAPQAFIRWARYSLGGRAGWLNRLHVK